MYDSIACIVIAVPLPHSRASFETRLKPTGHGAPCLRLNCKKARALRAFLSRYVSFGVAWERLVSMRSCLLLSMSVRVDGPSALHVADSPRRRRLKDRENYRGIEV